MKKVIRIYISLLLIFCLLAAVPLQASAASAYSFNNVDGTRFSSGEKDVTVLIFGRPTCDNTVAFVESVIDDSNIDASATAFAFVDVDGNSRETVQSFKNEYNGNKISFCYDTTGAANNLMWRFLSGSGSVALPVVIYLDKNNEKVYSTTGYQTMADIESALKKVGVTIGGEGETPMPSGNVLLDVNVKYCQTEARKLFDMVNDLRTGDESWYWNSANTEKIYKQLQALTYDYELEKVAMQRAAEIAVQYGHTRPDGTLCFTAYPPEYGGCAENIAAGYSSAAAVHDGFSEANLNYNGQGHRRNMLSSSMTCVGFGCVYYNGYYYWAEEFSDYNKQPVTTAANDEKTDVTIEVSTDSIDMLHATPSSERIDLLTGDLAEVPYLSISFSTTGNWPGRMCSATAKPDWKIGNTGVAAINGNTLKAVAVGDTVLECTFYGTTYSVPVSVSKPASEQLSFTLSSDRFGYSGTAVCPPVHNVMVGGVSLNESNYTVFYQDNDGVGTATVTVTGKGKYSGCSASKDFTIYCLHKTVTQKGRDATCTTAGVSDKKYCAYCGEVFDEGQVLPALGHQYSATIVRQPSCEGNGTRRYECSRCHTFYTETIPATGHQYTETTPRYPSCDKDGVKQYICMQCGDSYQETLPALGHKPGTPVKEHETLSTCTEEGGYVQIVYCSVCEEELSREYITVPRLAHQYEAEAVTPTCTKAGYTRYTCKLCGDTYTAHSTPALGHLSGATVKENVVAPTLNSEGSYDEVVYCRRCGEEVSRRKVIVPRTTCTHAHTATAETVTMAATCTKEGRKTVTVTCKDCGTLLSSREVILPKTAHKQLPAVKENSIPATCTENGSYELVVYCADCGKELSRVVQYVAAAGHSWDKGVVTKEPTTDAEGEKRFTCLRCGGTKTESLPRLKPAKTGWQTIGNHKYYYDANGVAVKWRQKIGKSYYYFNGAGVLQTGWIKGNTWMYAGSDGALRTGWQKIGGKWYCFSSNGSMLTGWVKSGGKWYFMDRKNGDMKTGWLSTGGKWYWLDASGAMAVGWRKIAGKWYFFNDSGVMRTASLYSNGKVYRFASSGVCLNP